MLRLAIDENFNNDIVRGLLRRQPDLDLRSVQDAELSGADDPRVLEWAAQENRVLLTHDVTTMTDFAFDRVADGRAMPGLFQVKRGIPLATVIEDILLLANCSLENEWAGQVHYLPLK